MLSLARTGLDALADPPHISGVIPSWLTEHLPLPLTDETESVLAALVASRAPLARNSRQQQATMRYALSWDWYIKDIPRRKLMYGQITDILIGLCSLLELTTDAAIFFYCACPERSPSSRERGRNDVNYTNLRALQNTKTTNLYTELMATANAFGDSLAEDWIKRQNAYDAGARQNAIRAMKGGRAAHLPGDFPSFARFDGKAAEVLAQSISQLGWTELGLAEPSVSVPGSPNLALPHQTHQSPAPTSRRGPETSVHPPGSIFYESGDAYGGEESEGDADDGATLSNDFVGRRARVQELAFMKTLGLTKLQILEVRLMLWEVESGGWHDYLKPMFGANRKAMFSLLSVLTIAKS
ncbi:hypothetical protein FS837_008343 [Tulasnella sp. UAMH 9824]|nr:hypothetical protein FS837_008343 [Tulasnella sp. UAMH 9824]